MYLPILHIISINHQHTDDQSRLSMHLSDLQVKELREYCERNHHMQGWVHLQTCNRVELIIQGSSDLDVYDIIHHWQIITGANLPIDQYQIITGTINVIQHLLELTTGLHSLVYGDDQILTQVKNAYEEERKVQGRLCTLLERSFQTIMRCHKAIIAYTDFKNVNTSIAYIGLKKIKERLSECPNDNIRTLIIGAGQMTNEVLKYLPKFSIGSVAITNRRLHRAKELSLKHEIKLLSSSDLKEYAPTVIINCTSVKYDDLKIPADPIIVIDYSLESNLSKKQSNRLRLCDMQSEILQKHQRKEQSIHRVTKIIHDHTEHFRIWVEKWMNRKSYALVSHK